MSRNLHGLAACLPESFDRLSYWQSRAAKVPPETKTIFNLPLAACLQLSARDHDTINAKVFDIVARSMPQGGNLAGDSHTVAGRQRLLEQLNKTMRFSIDAPNNLDRLVALEAELVAVFERLGLMNEIAGWQFPPDIRVVHPQPPDDYLARKDATDYLHCDPWRGEPADLVNVVLYCEAGDRASQLELYAVDPAGLSPFQMYSGDERAAESLLDGVSPVAFPHRSGQLIVFDGFLPHRTRRLGDRVRISLNFSMRRLNPYAVIDERWDRARQAWDKYWFVNSDGATTFHARCESELKRVDASENDIARSARRASLVKHFPVACRPILACKDVL